MTPGKPETISRRVVEVTLLFLRLGVTGFGGPAAHISMMRQEVVSRKKWLADEEFLDLNGATNLIPGPNSTEMAIHIGFLRAGWPGLLAAGIAFILPAMLIVMGLSWIYVRYSQLPDAGWLLYGVKPVVIAIIIVAITSLAKSAIKNALLAVAGTMVIIGYLFGLNEILLLIFAGLLIMIISNRRLIRLPSRQQIFIPILGFSAITASQTPYSTQTLFWTFVKIGSILYGSGYVLIAYLQSEFVNRLGWLTSQQVLDAITIGQITPGPVLSTATFIGYILGGPLGGVVATIGIFLPAFIFVAISNPFIPRLRRSVWFSGFLDGVNVASLGLMTVVCWQLGRDTLVDWITIIISIISIILLLKYKINPTWIIIGGLILGMVKHLFFS